ncbi:HD domain-containing protein [Nannocystis sp. ILAH1]|uniref:HD domain-containing protein n=1 Tax=unclassified Nannocystis TaxID=2627009 RepID=UPI00226F31AB|nr:HD domain-containing protein [Nannocystis sp. ILAH1]MCY1063387.1 HD domain-containing protein [Nannocystis sp. RBIL2]
MPPPPALVRLLGAPLLDSPWVQRLGRVSFLGTLDWHPRSHHPATRLDHSLGVAALGHRFGAALDLADGDLRHFVAACLLHDIGHFPLSHAAEPGFERALGVAHHGVSEWIVLGNGAIPEALSLRPVLQRVDLDPERVWAIIGGAGDGRALDLSALLLAPINLDTLDGIVRTARTFGRAGVRLPRAVFVRRGRELLIDPDALPVIDRFWALKDRIYSEVINLPSNIVCEAELSRAVADAFDQRVFARFAEFDDAALRGLADAHARRSGLSEGQDDRFQSTRVPPTGGDDVVPRIHKRYFVDLSVAPGPHGLPRPQWSRRYRHSRQLAFVSPRHAAAQLSLPIAVDDHVHEDMSRWTVLPGAEGPEI